MMFAIAYKDPETGDRFFCTGAKFRHFIPATNNPALYAQVENARKVLRDWRRQDTPEYCPNDYPLHIYDDQSVLIRKIWPIDYKDLEVVPIQLVPDFTKTITGDKA